MDEIISRAEARARGLSYYFTGVPCKHGHVAKRHVKGNCIGCVWAWKRANKEVVREGDRRRIPVSRKRKSELQRLRRNENLERAREMARYYYWRDIERSREIGRLRQRRRYFKGSKAREANLLYKFRNRVALKALEYLGGDVSDVQVALAALRDLGVDFARRQPREK